MRGYVLPSGATAVLFGSAQGEEVLRAFDRVLQTAQELLEVGTALDEVNIRGVDHQQIGRGVVKEEVLVRAGNLFDVFEGNLRFIARGFFSNASTQNFGFGLEIDYQI